MPQQMRIWKQVVLAGIIAGAGAILWSNQDSLREIAGISSGSQEVRSTRKSGAVPVIAAQVGTAEDLVALEIVGTGKAKRSVMLRSETSGRIVEMPLDAGTRFAAGDLLLRVDDEEQEVALALAEARLSEAVTVRKRLERLQSSGSVTRASFDQAVTAEQIAGLQVDRARVQLEDRRLHAPFSGVAGIPQVELGAWVDNSMEVASFDDRSELLVEFDVPEGFLYRIEPGTRVTATTPAVSAREFVGTVTAIDSRVASASRTGKVRVSIPNEEDRLRPGFSFTIRLELSGGSYPVIPELALQFARGGLHVWRISQDTAEKIDVRMVRRRNGMVLVDGELAAGDTVVVEGTQRLSPGREVEVLGSKTIDKPKTS